MDLRVLGCHGGETPRHRTTAFLLDERLAIDAGALTSQLEMAEQDRLQGVLVSHSHLDHIRDLATIVDNRCQRDCGTLDIIATKQTIAQLQRRHGAHESFLGGAQRAAEHQGAAHGGELPGP